MRLQNDTNLTKFCSNPVEIIFIDWWKQTDKSNTDYEIPMIHLRPRDHNDYICVKHPIPDTKWYHQSDAREFHNCRIAKAKRWK